MVKFRYNNLDNVSTDKTLKEFRKWREERRRKKKDYSYVVPSMPPRLAYLARIGWRLPLRGLGIPRFSFNMKG